MIMQKSCKEIADMLIDYVDGQLSPSDSDRVAEHLATCEGCRRTLQALRRSLELAGVIWENGLTDITPIRIATQEKVRKTQLARYAAVAAGILFILGGSILWRVLMRPAEKQLTFAEIEHRIEESASAARLLAAAELLAEYPDAKTIVKQQYRYIVEAYPEAPAAAKAKLRIE